MCLCSRFDPTFALWACLTTSPFRWPLWPCTGNPAANPWLGSATSLPAPRNGFSPSLQYHLIRGRWVLQARQQCSMYDLGPPSPDITTPAHPRSTPSSGVGVQVFSLEIKQVMPGMAHNTWMNGEPFLGYPSNSFHALRRSNYADRHQHSDWSYIRVTRVSLAWWLSGITGPWARIMLMPGLLFEPGACLGQIKTWWQ